MKVALVLERFDPHQGGLEHWTWQFAKALRHRGLDVQIVAFEAHAEAGDLGLTLNLLERPKSRIARAAALERAVQMLPVDVIHDMGVGWCADVFHPHGGSTIATWEHNLLRIPRWRQIRFWRERRYREMRIIEQRQHAREEALIVAVSAMVRRHFDKIHGIDPDRLRIIPNGVDVMRFSPRRRLESRAERRAALGLTPNETMFLLLAHNLRLKNADTLIRAAGLLASGGAKIRVIIAGGRKVEEWRRLAIRCGVGDRVTLLPPVSDPMELYAAADVYAQPTWYDPCSLVTLEAWACGLPVITTRFNGAAELLPKAGAELLLDDPGDSSALAALMRILVDPAAREAHGNAGRLLALERTFDQQTSAFLSLYDEVKARKEERTVKGKP
jgi:UDP-glucose:(heptosyl)LPS alpha-1,3-glucosyltransferase